MKKSLGDSKVRDREGALARAAWEVRGLPSEIISFYARPFQPERCGDRGESDFFPLRV